MLIDKSVIGTISGVHEFEVEKGAIRAFAAAIGDDNPLYRDESYAWKAGYRSIVAPPTFPITFRMPNPNVKFPLARVLHGEQRYTYQRPIVAGDVLRCVSRVVDVYERTGRLGEMTFLVSEVEGEDRDGQVVFRGRSTIIVR